MTTAAAWMDLGARILGDISQIKKDKYITYTWNVKYYANELIYNTQIDSQTQKTNFPKGETGGGMNWGLTGTDYRNETDKQQEPTLYHTQGTVFNSLLSPVTEKNEKNTYTYIYVYIYIHTHTHT